MLHLGPIWYHSEPSDAPYSQNLPRPISWFGLFLQQNDSMIAVNGCVDGAQDPCAVSNCCFMSNHWNKVNGAVRSALEDVSLADLVDPAALFTPRVHTTTSSSSTDQRIGN
mgnify:CR=1 FL=1